MNKERAYTVCAGWENDTPIGTLYALEQRGKEIQSFAYQPEWLANHGDIYLDPELLPYPGRQYAATGTFRFLADAAPDRWGRQLLDRKEVLAAKAEARAVRKLTDTDYLVGVADIGRTGGLRMKGGQGFLAAGALEIPPMAKLRTLQAAVDKIEDRDRPLEAKWLNQLLNPGSSLGGARPKANVLSPEKELWIAKFPSKNDQYHLENWEELTSRLAQACGICVPETRLQTLAGRSVFLSKRFDRQGAARKHFASAMTMLQKQDGEAASFLDLAAFLSAKSISPDKDLHELWRRLAFSVAVANTDCHLRNHGFLLESKGWRLAPMYDVNPTPYGRNLALAITKEDNTRSFDLVIATAPYYGITHPQEEIEKMATVLREQFKQLAEACLIPREERLVLQTTFGI